MANYLNEKSLRARWLVFDDGNFIAKLWREKMFKNYRHPTLSHQRLQKVEQVKDMISMQV